MSRRLLLSLVAVLAPACLSTPGALAAGEPGTPQTTGTSVNGVAGEPDGTAIAVGADGSNMLVQRAAVDGTLRPAFAAGPGSAKAVAAEPDGSFVVVGSDGNQSVVKRFTPDGTPDTSFGVGGTVPIPQITPSSVAIGPGGSISVGGATVGSDGYPDAAILRLTPSGTLDAGWGGGDGLAVLDVGRNATVNGVLVLPSGRVVFAGQKAPDLRTTTAILGRTMPTGAVDDSFASGGVATYQGSGVNSVFNSVALDAAGRLVAGGTEVTDSGTFATFARYSVGGAMDAAFGTKGVLRTPATANNTGIIDVGVRGVANAGGQEVVGVGVLQDAGRRSSTLWAISPNGQLDPSVANGGVVTEGADEGADANAVGVTPDGTLFVGGQDDSFNGTGTGTVTRVAGFGTVQVPSAIDETGSRSASKTGRGPALLSVASCRIEGAFLRVSGSLASAADGRVTVRYTLGKHTRTYRVTSRAAKSRRAFALKRALPRVLRASSGAVVRISSAASTHTSAEVTRLPVGRRSAALRLTKHGIDSTGFLRASGTISSRATGAVKVRFLSKDATGKTATTSVSVGLRRGRWSTQDKLPDAAASAGGELVVSYSHASHGALSGAQVSTTVAGGRPAVQLRGAPVRSR